MRKRDENDGGGGRGVRRESAFEYVVNDESAACFDGIFDQYATAAG